MRKFYILALLFCATPVFSSFNKVQTESFNAIKNNIDDLEMKRFYKTDELKEKIGYKTSNFRPMGDTSSSRSCVPSFYLYCDKKKSQEIYYSTELQQTNKIIFFYLYNGKNDKSETILNLLLENMDSKKKRGGILSFYYFSRETKLEDAQTDLINSFKNYKINVSLERIRQPQEQIQVIEQTTNFAIPREIAPTSIHKITEEKKNNQVARKRKQEENKKSRKAKRTVSIFDQWKLEEISRQWHERNTEILIERGILQKSSINDDNDEESTLSFSDEEKDNTSEKEN